MGRREQSREAKREAVVSAGLDRLLTSPIESLRFLLNASGLSGATDVSKDTTYRLFNEHGSASSDAIVEAVARASTRPEWSGYKRSFGLVASAFQKALQEERSFEEAIVEALGANIDAQFEAPGGPVGWVLHAAAITASPAWRGEVALSPRDEVLGRRLLSFRAEFYHQMTQDMVQMMTAAMGLIGRRLRRGMDPEQLVALMHALIDGAVLRCYLDRDALNSRLVAEAAFALAMAFSEEGTISDPHRPDTSIDQKVFERMLAAASPSWTTPEERTVDSTAAESGQPPEAARILFPTQADLADSVVWSGVLGGGSPFEEVGRDDDSVKYGPGTQLAMLLGLLRRVREVADELPGAVQVLERSQPAIGIGVRQQLVLEVSEVLRTTAPGVDARVTAVELVAAAFQGRAGWPAVSSLLRVLGVQLS